MRVENVDSVMDASEPREILTIPCPQKKVRDEDWPIIKALAEKGMTYKEIGELYGISHFTVGKRACREKWITPMRLSKAKNGTLATTSDPAHHVANLWTARADAAREQVHGGMTKAIERFLAMAPVPQSFAEAAIAVKLRNDAINPAGSAPLSSGTTVNILSSQSFSPKPVIDV